MEIFISEIPEEGLTREGTLPPSIFDLSPNDSIRPTGAVTYKANMEFLPIRGVEERSPEYRDALRAASLWSSMASPMQCFNPTMKKGTGSWSTLRIAVCMQIYHSIQS